MATRQELITATLNLLSLIGAGQAPANEDVETIDALIDGKILELNARGIYYSTDTKNFDQQYVDPLSTVLANTAAPLFGQPRNMDSENVAIGRIQAMKPSTYVAYSAQQTEYF